MLFNTKIAGHSVPLCLLSEGKMKEKIVVARQRSHSVCAEEDNPVPVLDQRVREREERLRISRMYARNVAVHSAGDPMSSSTRLSEDT